RPYTVSVGMATTSPARSSARARSIASLAGRISAFMIAAFWCRLCAVRYPRPGDYRGAGVRARSASGVLTVALAQSTIPAQSPVPIAAGARTGKATDQQGKRGFLMSRFAALAGAALIAA